MILAVTPNPSLDRTAIIPDFALGQTFRVSRTLVLAGGKGFNFARALKCLGKAALVVCPLGGHMGQALLERAEAEGLACDPLWIAGETRTGLTILDPQAHQITELYESGPTLNPGDWNQLMIRIRHHASAIAWMAVCGSFPPGVHETELRDLVEEANAAGIPILVDAYGPQLAHALSVHPTLVKINHHEAADLLTRPIETPATALDAAAEMQARGARAVVITLGAQGAVGIDSVGQMFGWSAPKVQSVFPVGSGDSFLAGVMAGLSRYQSLKEATRLGVAAGAANTLRIGAGVFERTQAEALLNEISELS